MRPNTVEDVWRMVDRSSGTTGCWPFTGSRNPGWHGRIKIRGRMVVASRAAWESTFGPIPAGLYVLHACDSPTCCNPGHLMLGTNQANSIDAGRKGRMGTGKNATHCKRGHAFEGNTYIHPVTGRRACHECIRQRDRQRVRTKAA